MERRIKINEKKLNEWINSSSTEDSSTKDNVLSEWLKDSLKPNKDPDKILAEEVEEILGKDALRLSKREMQDLLVKARRENPKSHKEPISKEDADEIFKALQGEENKKPKPPIDFRPWG